MNIAVCQRTVHLMATGCLLVLLLISSGCAVQPGKPAEQQPEKKVEADKLIVVEPAVQQDFERALQLLKAGDDVDTAIALLRSVVEREQRLAAPYVNLALALLQKGDDKQAQQYLLKALAIDSHHPQASNQLGLLYRKQGKFEQAKNVYRQALAQHPKYLPVIRNLAILCDIYMRDLECALEQYETLQQHMPDDKTVRIWIADLKARM